MPSGEHEGAVVRRATRGSLDERKWELLRKKGAASDLALDGQLVGEQRKPIDWKMMLREMRAAGVRSSGEELDEDDLRALWERAEGPYARLGRPATVAPLPERLAAERPRADARERVARGRERPARLRPRRLSGGQ